MSNFVDVIKQYKKLCDSISGPNCRDNCPIRAEFNDYINCMFWAPEKFEEIVMNWANTPHIVNKFKVEIKEKQDDAD